MGKKGKKGKKGKRGKSPTKDEKPPRTCITLEDVIAQEAKFNTRLEGIKETKERIKAINSIIKADKRKQNKEKAWNKYLSCDGLPKASVPTEIRDFLAKWQYFEDMDAKDRCSWLLQRDERSILTQDIDAINNTRKHLKASQVDRGDIYNNHIVRMLTVLLELREVLASSKHLSSSIYRDLLELKDVMLRTIQGCIDSYTFRLVRDEEANFNDLDSITADYHYKSDVIQIHLWAFKPVPIQFLPDQWPKEIVNFHALRTEVILPFAVLCSNLVLRGLHMVYDHYSEYTKTFSMPETSFLDESLDVVLNKEWEKRKELQGNIRAEMIKEREQYEQWAAQKEEEEKLKEEQSKRDKKAATQSAPKAKPKKKTKKQKKSAPPKHTREPIKLDTNTFPDVENDYLAFYEQCYTDFMNDINPENFKMEEGEVNLREYLLMGGVYEFNFVQNPRQTNFPKLIMTWLEHPIVLRYKNRNCFLKECDFESIGLGKNRERGGMDDEDELQDNTNTKPKAVTSTFQFNEQPLTFFILTFKVPPEICRWQTPTVCQWYEVAGTLDDKQNAFPKSDKDLELRTPVVINDFVLSRTLEIPMMFHIINHLVPRFISIHQFPEELEKRSGAKRKFALEEIEMEEKGEKAEQIVKMPAERLFPVFNAVTPVVIIPMEEGTLNQEGIKDQTIKLFSDYVHELEHIKFTKLPFFKETKQRISEQEEEDTVSRKSSTLTNSKSRKSLGKSRKSEAKKPKSKKEKKGKKKKSSGKSSVHKDEITKMVHFFETGQTVEEEDEEEILSHEESEISLGSDKESVNSKLECLNEIPEHPKWSTKNIFKTEFDDKEYELKIWTNRLGIFAFAFKKYIHLPFRVWTMQPDPENYKIIKYYAESKYAKFCVDITEEGYSVQVLDYKLAKGYPIVLYENQEPFTEIKTLKEQLQSIDMNIFPDRDAIMYLKKIPEKHLPIENHTYECMGLTCMFMQYCISPWNRVSNRRVISMQCRSYDEDLSALETVKITPEECQIVKIKELCTDLNVISLQFNPTWRNLKYNPDLLSLINSAYFRVLSSLKYEQLHNPKLQYNVIKFLKAVRPISFSW